LIYTDEEYVANIYGKAELFKDKIGEKLPEVKIRDESQKHEMENITPLPEPKPIDIFKYTLKSEKNLKGLIDIDDELKLLLDNCDKDNVEIVLDDTPYSNRYKKRYAKVKAIIDDYTIEIYDDIEMTEIEKENLFIYGKKVDDFLKLDYKSLYCLNIKATQELYKTIQKQQEIINTLKTEINHIKSVLNIS